MRFCSLISVKLFLAGFGIGFFSAGPALLFIYILLNKNPSPVSFINLTASKSVKKLNTAEYPFFTSGVISKMNAENKILLLGSSELLNTSKGNSVMEHLSRRFDANEANPFVPSSSFEGSAVSRFVYFYTGAVRMSHFPERAMIVFNPFYAAQANFFYKNYMDTNYPDRFSIPGEFSEERSAEKKINIIFQNYTNPFLSSLIMLNKRIAVPLKEKLFIKHSGRTVDDSAPSRNEHSDRQEPLSNSAPVKKFKLPENFQNSYTGKMLNSIRLILKREPDIKLCILVLPAFPGVTPEQKITSSQFNRELLISVKKIAGISTVFSAPELSHEELFTDQIHYTDRGRAVLAMLIEKNAGYCFPESIKIKK